MTALGSLWFDLKGYRSPDGRVFDALSRLSPWSNDLDAAPWPARRESVLVWLQSLEALARGLGYPVPSPSAATFSTVSQTAGIWDHTGQEASPAEARASWVARNLSSHHLPGVDSWGSAWATIATDHHLPPETIFEPTPAPADASGVLPWVDLARHARERRAPSAVVAHLDERSNKIFANDSPLQPLDIAARKWWAQRLNFGWGAGEGPGEAHGTTPVAPPPATHPAEAAHHAAHVDIGPGTTVTPASPNGAPQTPAAGAPGRRPIVTPPTGGGFGKILAAGVFLWALSKMRRGRR